MKSELESKDLLLSDYHYLSESFWRNEQAGETRVNLFLGIATAVIGGLITLSTQEHGLSGEPLRFVVVAGLVALFILGVVTLVRLVKRNRTTDVYVRGLDSVRQTFKDHLDPEGILAGYYPFVSARPKKEGRGFGGLAHSVTAINSLAMGAIVAAATYRVCDSADSCIENGGLVGALFLTATMVAFAAQFAYVSRREKTAKEELRDTYTHAFGLVYKLENGFANYLLVRPRNGDNKWVLPKGHVEKKEGYGEAALREVREETGMRALLIGCVGEVEYRAGEDRVKGKGYLLELISTGKPIEQRPITWLPLGDALREVSFEESRYLLAAAERKRLAITGMQTERLNNP